MNEAVIIYVGLLKAVAFMQELLDILLGIRNIDYGNQSMSLYDLFFHESAVSAVFWGITVIGLALAIGFSIVAITRQMADLKLERKMGATLGHIGKTMLMFLITPLMILTVFQLVSVVMQKADEMFYIANGGYTIDATMFALTAKNAVIEDPAVIDKFASGELSYYEAVDVEENLNGQSIMTWVGIPLTLTLIVLYALCLMVLSFRLFMMILLYIVSPFFVASMVLDDGAKYKAWRESLFAKVFSGFSLLLSLKILTFIIVPFLVGDVMLTENQAGDITLKCLFACGAVFGAYKSSSTLVKIIAPKAESEDAMILGAIVAAAKKTAARAWEGAKNAANAAVGVGRMASGDVTGGAKQLGKAAVNQAKSTAGDVQNAAGNVTGAEG